MKLLLIYIKNSFKKNVYFNLLHFEKLQFIIKNTNGVIKKRFNLYLKI